jgi:hypothetical protein
MPLPTIGTSYGFDLNGVSCVSAGSCVAVGTVYQGSVRATALYSWDGTNWSGVLGPAPASYANVLNSVACFTRTRCIAGGLFSNVSATGRAYTKTLIVAWNDGAVTLVRSPKLAQRVRQLFGVSCSERAFCIAVGTAETHRRSEPLALVRSDDPLTPGAHAHS